MVVAAYIRGQHQHRAEASDAGGREDVGVRASARQRRSRLDRSCSGRSWPGRSMTASRSSGGATPGRRRFPAGGVLNDVIAVVVGIVDLSGARFCLPSRRDRRAGVRSLTDVGAVRDQTYHRARYSRPQGRRSDRLLTSYHAHTAALVDRYCDVILVGDSLGMVMHGFETTVPVTLDMMILQGQAVMRGSQARAGGRRHAVRVLRGVEGAGLSCRRARAQGNRLRRHQARGRRAHGGNHRLSGRARHSGDGPYRADAAVDQRARLVPRAGPRGGRLGTASKPTPRRSPTPARFPW